LSAISLARLQLNELAKPHIRGGESGIAQCVAQRSLPFESVGLTVINS
jgi:hypothetical protein